ncbi:MAG TPA: hypothetical protein VGE29_00975 [Prosthecobacter sp.]
MPVWKEGDVRVYGKNGQYTLMVRRGGYSMDVLDEQIVQIGSDERWLVVRQWRDNVSRFYVLKKPLGILSPFDFEKPLSQERFDRLKVKDGLPPFTWHNRWVDYAEQLEEAMSRP